MSELRKVHPVANIVPMMSAAEYQRLVASIRKVGQLDPIMINDGGLIIDGRNRYRACMALKVKPIFKSLRLREGVSLLEYVLAKNIDRRHLTASVRAMVAADAREYLLKTEGKTSLESFTKRINGQTDDNDSGVGECENLNVSKTYIQRALNIKKRGCQELEDAVRRGMINVTEADRLATFPVPVQKRLIDNGVAAIKEFLKKPDKEARQATETTETRMADWNRQCEFWARRIIGASKEIPDLPILDSGIRDTIESHLQAAAASIRAAKSYALCPKCSGNGCEFCSDLGFVNRVTYESNHH